MVRISASFANVALLLTATSSHVAGTNWNQHQQPSCQSITDLACTTPNLSTLCSLLQEANLDEVLGTNNHNSADFTVFAPTNNAFDKLPADIANAVGSNPALLADVLKYHVTSGEIFSQDLNCGDKILMLNGGFTYTKCISNGIFQVGDGSTKNNLPEISTVDIEACNGVVHIVEEVILPGSGSNMPGSDYCTYAPDFNCYENGKPRCCSDNNRDCPTHQPICDYHWYEDIYEGPDYCSAGLNYKCYKDGLPECCLSQNKNCPVQKPVCDSFEDHHFYDGPNYCSLGLNYNCYEFGRPRCCFNDNVECPYNQPVCDYKNNDNLFGPGYCSNQLDFGCCEYGRPECCFNNYSECPSTQPVCDHHKRDTFSDPEYCSFGLNYGCYEFGRPKCCYNNNLQCTVQQPSCDVHKPTKWMN